MINALFLYGIIISGFLSVTAKRLPALVHSFMVQSLFLWLFTLSRAAAEKSVELLVVAVLILCVKVVVIPQVLLRMVKKIKGDENLGFYANPLLSLVIAAMLSGMAYMFSVKVMPLHEQSRTLALAVSLSVTSIGLFLMVARMKAIAQVIGLLVMENGIFLAAAAVSQGVPFFVEIALFFDIFVCVIILGIFVFKINRLFTHIDVNRLNNLKG